MNDTTKTPASKKSAPKPAPAKKAETGKPAPKVTKPVGKAPVPPKTPRVTKPKPEGFKSTDALRDAAQHYEKDKEHKTASGNPSVDNGDGLAKSLRGMDLGAVYAKAASVLQVPEKELRAKYAHLNAGMQRMNLGNRMRAAQHAGNAVKARQ